MGAPVLAAFVDGRPVLLSIDDLRKLVGDAPQLTGGTSDRDALAAVVTIANAAAETSRRDILAAFQTIEPIQLDLTDAKAEIARVGKATVDQDAILRQADNARAQLAAAQISSLLDQNVQRITIRDAGLITDKEAGRIYFYGLDQNSQSISKVQADLNSVTGKITLLATRDDVATAITQAQLSPADAAQFGALIARQNSTELTLNAANAAIALKADAITVTQLGGMVQSVAQTLDALAGLVTTKVSYADFTPVRERIGYVEQVLGSAGEVSTYGLTLRQAEIRTTAAATAGVLGLVTASENAQRDVARAAEITQQLTVRMDAGDAAEAASRFALAALVGQNMAGLVEERSVRADAVGAVGKRIDLLTVDVGTNAASIARVEKASADGLKAQADRTDLLSASVGGFNASLAQQAQALADESQARTTLGTQVRAEFTKAVADADSRRNAGDTAVLAEVARVDTAVASERDVRAQSVQQLSLSLNGQNARITSLTEAVIGPSGTSLRAVTVLDAKGRVSGTYNTNDGTVAAFGVVADKFGVYHPTTGALLFYVDVDGAMAANFKPSSVGPDTLQLGAVQKVAFYKLDQSITIPRGQTGSVSLQFTKEDADSILEIFMHAKMSSQDDLQFAGTFAIDGNAVDTTPVNIILVNKGAAMPISPFTYATSIGAGMHTVTFTMQNNESDDRTVTLGAGSVLKVNELRKASIGSATGSGSTTVAATGSSGNVGGTGTGGAYSGGTSRNQIQ